MADKPEPKKEFRIALYARVSKRDQSEQAQVVRLREWAERSGYTVVGEFTERASGRLVRRPEQDKVMTLVRGHHVHGVAVVKLDRWGRSLIDLKNSIEEMVENHVKFFAVESGVTYEKHTPIGKLFLAQLASFAEFEADLISERTKDALDAKKSSGKAWVSKSGRLVSKLGPSFDPCWQCGGPRVDQTRGKRGGKTRMLCRSCKGLPAIPAKTAPPPKVVYEDEQVQETEEEEEEDEDLV